MLIAINKLRLDGGTQPRVGIDADTAYDYGDEMKAGAKFPPVVVFHDGESYWLADGFHRVEGALSAQIREIECDLHQGTVADAQWYSYGVNKSHGLRRTNDDKHRAVKAALAHPNGASKSDSVANIGRARQAAQLAIQTCTVLPSETLGEIEVEGNESSDPAEMLHVWTAPRPLRPPVPQWEPLLGHKDDILQAISLLASVGPLVGELALTIKADKELVDISSKASDFMSELCRVLRFR